MLTTAEINDLLAHVTYRPGWAFVAFEREYEGQHILIYTNQPNAYRPGEDVELRIFSPLPPFLHRSDLYYWLLWRLARIETHEACEFFRVDGKPWYDPHAEGDTSSMLRAVDRARELLEGRET